MLNYPVIDLWTLMQLLFSTFYFLIISLAEAVLFRYPIDVILFVGTSIWCLSSLETSSLLH